MAGLQCFRSQVRNEIVDAPRSGFACDKLAFLDGCQMELRPWRGGERKVHMDGLGTTEQMTPQIFSIIDF